MGKQNNNYSNVFLPKTISNSHRLALNGLRFQPDSVDRTGQFLKVSDANGEIISETVNVSEITSQTIEVHPDYSNEGSKRNTIGNAITYAATLSPSVSNVILIDVLPGFYAETTTLSPPDYVHIRGRDKNTCYVQLQNALGSNQFVRITNTNISFFDLTIDAQAFVPYCYKVDSSQHFIEQCQLLGGTTSVLELSIASSITFVIRCFLAITNTSCSQVINISNNAQFGSQANVITDLANTKAKIGYNFSGSSTPATGFRNQPSATALSNFDICVKLDDSTFINSLGDFFSSNTGVQLINNSSATLHIMSLNCDTNINCDSTSSVFTNGCLFNDVANLTVANNENISIDYFEEALDNQLGRHQLGNLTCGSKTIPSISFFGTGAYNFDGVQFLKTDDGITYTNVTNDLKPSVQTPITLFDDLTNSIFYIGDDEKYYSLEYDVATILSGSLQFEYWDGSAWVEFNIQTTQAARPYGSYSNNTFTAIECQDTRYTIELTGSTFNWSKSTIDSLNKYWTRITIVSPPLTTSPVLNFLRLIYSSTKIDGEGVSLRFGNARSYKTIVYDVNLIRGTSGATQPGNQDIWYGEDSRLGRERNDMGPGDIWGFCFFAPTDLDSSSPIRAILAFSSDSTAATQAAYNFQVTIGNMENGDQVYYTQASANGNQIRDQFQITTTALQPNQTNGTFMVITEISLPIPFIKSRDTNGDISDLLHIDIERLTGGNDSNAIVFSQVSILYLSYSDGISIA